MVGYLNGGPHYDHTVHDELPHEPRMPTENNKIHSGDVLLPAVSDKPHGNEKILNFLTLYNK